METYRGLLELYIENISKLIWDVEELLPNNETQGQYKYQVQACLAAARMDLREALDSMDWYLRKA